MNREFPPLSLRGRRVVRSLQHRRETTMKLQSLHQLYVQHLQDLLGMERQIKASLPGWIKTANDEDLKSALKNHLQNTIWQIERLNDMLRRHGAKREGLACPGIQSLLSQTDQVAPIHGELILRDLHLISHCQRIEHFEIASYGAARTMAERLNEEADAELLITTMQEESTLDDELTSIATILLSLLDPSLTLNGALT